MNVADDSLVEQSLLLVKETRAWAEIEVERVKQTLQHDAGVLADIVLRVTPALAIGLAGLVVASLGLGGLVASALGIDPAWMHLVVGLGLLGSAGALTGAARRHTRRLILGSGDQG